MSEPNMRERLNIVLAGHVDHGKSTIVGRLLADSGALPDGKLAQVKAYCERNARPFEYAFLVDALKNEQAQGVTIDSARVFFRTGDREYVLIDAPGHVEFVKNMVSGAARADAALLVIDAMEGVQENSKRHGTLLSLLGIRQAVVLVNKMDLASYKQRTFDKIVAEYTAYLDQSGLKPMRFIPVSGMQGDNVALPSKTMPWYAGPTVLDSLVMFQGGKAPLEKPFRMWVQGVYRFTNDGDTRRIVSGTIESGKLNVGDHIIFYPSGKKSSVKAIETFPSNGRSSIRAGEAAGFTLTEQMYLTRGELAMRVGDPRPHVTSRFRSSLFWLGKRPMSTEKEYLLKIGTTRVPCKLENVHSIQDAASLARDEAKQINRYKVADCDLQLARAIAFDCADDFLSTGRFVIVDDYEICGGGIIREALEDRQTWVREKVLLRDYKWETSNISAEERASRFRQKPALMIITGEKHSGKKPLAKALEAQLVSEGYLAYFLGIGNILYGVDADIKGKGNDRQEHIRRLAEVAHIILDAGFILIVTAIELLKEELEIIQTTVAPDQIVTIWRGKAGSETLSVDASMPEVKDVQTAVNDLKVLLEEKKILKAF